MAVLPAIWHTRAFFRRLLSDELPCSSEWHGKDPRVDTIKVSAQAILPAAGLFWSRELDLQHDFPHPGLQCNREAGLLCGRRQRAVWTVLYADSAISAGSAC